MANLQELLNKNKSKIKDLTSTRVVVRAAMTDRPYDLEENFAQEANDLDLKRHSELETNVRQTEDKHKTIAPVTNLEKKIEQEEGGCNQREKLKFKENKKAQPQKNVIDNDIDFMQLTGLQKQITYYVYGLCKAKRDKITPPLAVEAIGKACEINKMSIRKTIQRLEEKKVLFRHAYKEGERWMDSISII